MNQDALKVQRETKIFQEKEVKRVKQARLGKLELAIDQAEEGRELLPHVIKSVSDPIEIKEILQITPEPHSGLMVKPILVQGNPLMPQALDGHAPLPIQRIQPGGEKSHDRIHIKSIGFSGDVFEYSNGLDEDFMETALIEALVNKKLVLPASVLIRDLQGISIELSSILRKKGLVFNIVALGAQKVVNGHVTMNVSYGVLSEVKVYDNKVYSTEQISAPFKQFLEYPLYGPSVKGAMLQLRMYAGLKTFSYYSHGRSHMNSQ